MKYLRSRGPFLERPGNFSGPKSHFKNHEAFYVESFLCKQVLHLSKAYTYVAFQIYKESFWFFSYGILKLASRARKLSGDFRETGVRSRLYTCLSSPSTNYGFVSGPVVLINEMGRVLFAVLGDDELGLNLTEDNLLILQMSVYACV